MKDNEKRTNDMQQETTAPREAGPILRRFMRETDVPACAAVEACADDGWSEAALREELAQENARLFVAEAEGKVAGLAVFQLVCGEASLYARKHCARLSPPGRGTGIAVLGVRGAVPAGRAGRVPGSARPEQRRAGAVPLARLCADGLRRNFYATPADDAVLMQKTL